MSFSVEWAIWRRYYLSRNASVASSGLESKWRRGGEVAGSPSLTTRNSMEPAIEMWCSMMAVKAGRSVYVN